MASAASPSAPSCAPYSATSSCSCSPILSESDSPVSCAPFLSRLSDSSVLRTVVSSSSASDVYAADTRSATLAHSCARSSAGSDRSRGDSSAARSGCSTDGT
eukprot:358837-Chlamydomonas_euryale.AAC.2